VVAVAAFGRREGGGRQCLRHADLQKPMELGVDIVVYSTTKHIDGQGRCLGGVVLASEEWIDENLHDYYRHTGPAMSPFNAWVMLKGLETLPLRVNAQTATAGKVADFLAERSEVKRVIYPGRPTIRRPTSSPSR
jgi:O-succinylhomoserine sulfhydrylase